MINLISSGKDMLFIWDADGVPPVGNWTTVLWAEYASHADPSVVSIPQLVDQHSDYLRSRYLAWIHNLGELRIDGRRVVNLLALRSGFSYWWMTSLAQKFNASGSSHINDAIKALALEMFVVARQVKSIVLISRNHNLGLCVQGMCLRKGLSYEFRPIRPLPYKYNLRSLYRSLPHPLRAYLYILFSLIAFLPFCLKKSSSMHECVGEVMFIDVLSHLDKRAVCTGSFISNYWTSLVERLAEWKIKSNWLHIYFRHPVAPTPAKAQRLIRLFNRSSEGSQFHALLERYSNLRLLAKVWRDYLTVNRAFARLRRISGIRPSGSDLNLWSLHSEEWRDSLCGKESMTNCLRLALFEEAVSRFPSQRLGIYISENQPWEMALLYAWKAAGHGTLIGYAHTVVRFWDLRYFYDPRSYLRNNDMDLPLPDTLALNGPAAREIVLASGYPPDRICEVEALRFLHLSRSHVSSVAVQSNRHEIRVLVCGDFLAETNRRMIDWLEIASKLVPLHIVYVFKPHPAYPLNSDDISDLQFEISDDPLADLLPESDVVFTSNITSAAVDAYCSGISVIQILDGSTFNMSPLRGLNGVVYVTNPMELAKALANSRYLNPIAADPYFNLNTNLHYFKNLFCSNTDQSL